MKEDGTKPKNKDMATVMGMNSVSTISEILARRQNIQPEQWERFRKKYKISEKSDSRGTKTVIDTNVILNGATVSLQEYIDELRRDKALLNRQIETNLTALMQLLTALSHHDRAWHETILRSLERLEKKKPDQLIVEARMSEAAKTLEVLNMDSGSKANR
jgi:hypothetical protein